MRCFVFCAPLKVISLKFYVVYINKNIASIYQDHLLFFLFGAWKNKDPLIRPAELKSILELCNCCLHPYVFYICIDEDFVSYYQHRQRIDDFLSI